MGTTEQRGGPTYATTCRATSLGDTRPKFYQTELTFGAFTRLAG